MWVSNPGALPWGNLEPQLPIFWSLSPVATFPGPKARASVNWAERWGFELHTKGVGCPGWAGERAWSTTPGLTLDCAGGEQALWIPQCLV